ncbi:hypothetical protein HDU96_002250 [Phlyctochytrium bullatum]|nr:hypothetical protein HDU96_002250 [Phlyctochytrium bullatum]
MFGVNGIGVHGGKGKGKQGASPNHLQGGVDVGVRLVPVPVNLTASSIAPSPGSFNFHYAPHLQGADGQTSAMAIPLTNDLIHNFLLATQVTATPPQLDFLPFQPQQQVCSPLHALTSTTSVDQAAVSVPQHSLPAAVSIQPPPVFEAVNRTAPQLSLHGHSNLATGIGNSSCPQSGLMDSPQWTALFTMQELFQSPSSSPPVTLSLLPDAVLATAHQTAFPSVLPLQTQHYFSNQPAPLAFSGETQGQLPLGPVMNAAEPPPFPLRVPMGLSYEEWRKIPELCWIVGGVFLQIITKSKPLEVHRNRNDNLMTLAVSFKMTAPNRLEVPFFPAVDPTIYVGLYKVPVQGESSWIKVGNTARFDPPENRIFQVKFEKSDSDMKAIYR